MNRGCIICSYYFHTFINIMIIQVFFKLEEIYLHIKLFYTHPHIPKHAYIMSSFTYSSFSLRLTTYLVHN